MCHPDAPATPGPTAPVREEVRIPLAGGDKLPALLARAEGGGPGVLLITDIYGRTPFYEALAGRLAAEGFTTLLPDLFFRLGPLSELTRPAAIGRRQRLDDRQALQELGAAVDWLRGHSLVTGERTGVVGFCLGGTFQLNLAAERDDLAGVCYYGFPRPRRSGVNPTPAPLDQSDRISGPIIGFWGDKDEGVGMDNVERLAGALAANGVDFDHTIYPGLGHGFLAAALDQPDEPDHKPAVDSWARALVFLGRHLSGAP